jgi:transcriptional regulator of nitric oxide reductase
MVASMVTSTHCYVRGGRAGRVRLQSDADDVEFVKKDSVPLPGIPQ